ncbi:hypothetical protein FRW55_01800 [Mycoplasma anserisalpingitidis]|uniref:Uncharacterized protein n=1 Tax=Mycoplasma anserisalpingitidis TaxID=519450 RepID=A0A5B8J765_9MOLU|nr:hypothetical protein [Mycoplasma anserisalpingitidis]QDY86892.1 hypothetical protein FRW55_01800 [Mycoplasma anserisalpingitidis]
MSIKNKKSKIIYTSTAVSAGVALGLGAYTFSIHENKLLKDDSNKNTKFEELISKKNEIEKLIQELGAENVSGELLKLYDEIVNKMESNSVSVDEVFELVNKTEYLVAFEKVRDDIRNDRTTDNSIEDLKKLFKNISTKEKASELIDLYKEEIKNASSKDEKNQLLNELENKLSSLYNEDNLANQDLEKSIIRANGLLNDPNFAISNDLRSQIESLIKNANDVENLDANTSEILSNRLNDLIDLAINENNKNISEFEKLRKKANAALENLKTQNLDQSVKQEIEKQINDLIKSTSEAPNEDNYFLNYDLLNKKLDSIIDSASKYDKSVEELKEELNNSLNTNFEFRKNEEALKNKFNELTQQLSNSELNDKSNLIDAIRKVEDSKNKVLALRNEFDKSKDKLDRLINEGKVTSDFANILDNLFNSLTSDELAILDFDQTVNDLEKKLADFNSNINNQLLLKDEINDSIKDLDDLVANGLNVDKEVANKLKEDLEALKNTYPKNEEKFKAMFNKFNELSTQLKDLHKKELADLAEANKKYLEKDYIDEDSKKRLEALINSSESLANPNSQSVLSQIKPKEELLREFLKNNQKLENRYEFNNNLDDFWNSSIEGFDSSKVDADLEKNVDKFFSELKEEINSINEDSSLSNEEKVQKINELMKKAELAKENAEKLKDYSAIAKESLEVTNEIDPVLRQALKNAAKDITDTISANNDKVLDLDTLNVDEMSEELKNKINDYKELRDAIIGNRLFEDTMNKINYEFVNDRENDEDTPMQTALKNKLNEIKTKLDNPNITESEKSKLNDEMITLRNNIATAHQLEVANKKLKIDVENSEYYDFGDHKPEDLINEANNLTDVIDNLIKTEQTNPDYILSSNDSNNRLKDKLDQVEYIDEKLNKEVARNNLVNTVDNISVNKTKLTGEPFDTINKSIDDLIQDSKAYTDANSSKTADEINDFNFRVQANIELAQTLNNAQQQIKNLSDDNRDFILKKMTNVALANKIDAEDSFATIQEKTKKIRDAITQISNEIKTEEALKELDKVFPKPDSVDNRAIYSEEQKKYQKLYDELKQKYENIVNDDNIVNKNSELIGLITEINKAKNNAELAKKQLDTNYNNQVQLIKTELEKYKESALKNNVNPLYLSKLEAEFNKLIDNSSKSTTTMEDLANIKDKIRFEYAKDELDTAKKAVEDFMVESFNTNAEVEELKNKYQNNIQDTIDQIYNSVKDNTEASLNDYLNAKKLIDAAKKYAEGAKNVIDRIVVLDEDAKKPEEDRKYSIDSQPLKDAMDKNQISFDKLTNPDFESLLQDTVTKTNNIEKAYNDSLTFDELKNSLLDKISEFNTESQSNITSDLDDKEFATVFANTVKKIKDEALKIKYDQLSSDSNSLETAKSELLDVQQKLNTLKSNFNLIQKASQSARVAQDEIDVIAKLNPASEIQTKIKEKLESLAKLQRETYDSQDVSADKINKTSTEITSLVTILKNIREFDVKLSNLQNKITSNLNLNDIEVTNSTTNIKNNLPLVSSDAQTRVNSYLTHLRESMDNLGKDLENINVTKITQLNKNLSSFSDLVELQITNIAKYNEIKSNVDKATSDNEKKIHEWSYKFLGDSIIKSALIDVNDNEVIFNSNLNILDIESKEKARIYKDRLEDFKAVSEYKDEMLKKFTVTGRNTDLHNELKTVLTAAYDKTLEEMAFNGTKDTDINPEIKDKSNYQFTQSIETQTNNLLIFSLDKKQSLNLIHVQVDKYIAGVELINEKVVKANGDFQNLKNNTQYSQLPIISTFITETERLVKENKNAWVVDISPTSINSKKEALENYLLRIDLLNAYAKAKISLENDITNGTLTVDEAAPLQKIITNLENEIQNISGNKSQSYYDSLKEKYLEGNTETSLKKAKANTLSLKTEIKNAETVKAKYEEYKLAHPNFVGSADMIALYAKLDQIIATAKTNITNIDNRNEKEKESSISAINDSAFGIIAELQDKKLTEAKQLLRESNRINNFMAVEYTQTNSPKLNDFDAIAVQTLDSLTVPSLSNFDWINNTNDLMNAAREKIKDQKTALFNFERAQIVESIKKSKLYRDLFKNGIDTTYYTSEALKTIAGISEAQYKNLDDALNEIGDEANINIPDADKDFADENYKTHIYNDIRSKKIKLDNAYNSIKSTSRITLNNLKDAYDKFNAQVTTNGTNDAKTIKDYLNTETKFDNSNLQTLITEYTSKVTAFTTDDVLPTLEEEKAKDYNDVFTGYKTFLTKLIDDKLAYEKLLFKDTNSLKTILNTYINNRKDVGKLLELIAGDNYKTLVQNNDKSKPFYEFIQKYNDKYASIKNIIDSMNANIIETSKISTAEATYYLTSAYNATIKYRDWLNERVNFENIFLELSNLVNPTDSTSYRYSYSEIKDGNILENFITDIEAEATNKTTITVNGDSKEAILLNGKTKLLDYFNAYSILKNTTNDLIFNTDNIKVYIYKNNSSDKWIETVFQSDTRYKNAKYNLAIVFDSSVASNTYFSGVPQMVYTYPNVQTKFKTLEYGVITKDLLPFVGKGYAGSSVNDEDERRRLFHFSEAGWTDGNALSKLLEAFKINVPGNKVYAISDYSTTKTIQYTPTKTVEIPTGPNTVSSGIYFVGNANKNIVIDGKQYNSDEDVKLSFISTYSFDDHGDIAWIPTFISIPLFQDLGNGTKSIALLVMKWQFEPVADVSKYSNSHSFYAYSHWPTQSNLVILKDSNSYGINYLINSTDTKEEKINKVLEFADNVLTENAIKDKWIASTNNYQSIDALDFQINGTGKTPRITTLFDKFNIIIKLNKETGE